MFLLYGNICAGCRVVGMYSISICGKWVRRKWEGWREREGGHKQGEKRGERQKAEVCVLLVRVGKLHPHPQHFHLIETFAPQSKPPQTQTCGSPG